MSSKVDIEKTWANELESFFQGETWEKLSFFIKQEYKTKKVYPSPKDIFKAFWLTPFTEVKVVILGQDPYHGAGQAEGLCFSVPEGVSVPPSLQNVYKEIESDVGVKKDLKNGHLESWARQGVFLLNAILTVLASKPASHKGVGWEDFTDFIIKTISDKHEHVVFMLWGNYARSKKALIDTKKHLVLEATHPSPFSVHNGFFGSKHFSKCNQYLKANGKSEIQW